MFRLRILAKSVSQKYIWNTSCHDRILYTTLHSPVLLWPNYVDVDKKNWVRSESKRQPNKHVPYCKKNTLKTFLLIGLCFVLCWSGSQFNYLLYNIGYPADWNSTCFKVITLMAFGNCMINPFVYLVKYKDFQEGLIYLCLCTPRACKFERSLHSIETVISKISSNKAPKC